MNKVFKKIWNKHRGCFVAVSEAMTSASQRAGKASVIIGALAASIDLVIAVAFRIDSIESRVFREFIMQSVIGKQTSRTKLVCIFTENAMA